MVLVAVIRKRCGLAVIQKGALFLYLWRDLYIQGNISYASKALKLFKSHVLFSMSFFPPPNIQLRKCAFFLKTTTRYCAYVHLFY